MKQTDFCKGDVGEIYVLLELLKVCGDKFVPFKAYTKQKGWDIACISSDKLVCTIQVKYRGTNQKTGQTYTNVKNISVDKIDFLVVVNESKDKNNFVSYVIPKENINECLRENGLCSSNILEKLGHKDDKFERVLKYFNKEN